MEKHKCAGHNHIVPTSCHKVSSCLGEVVQGELREEASVSFPVALLALLKLLSQENKGAASLAFGWASFPADTLLPGFPQGAVLDLLFLSF